MPTIKLFTAKEVAKVLKLNILTIYEYMRSGQILAIKFGKNYRVLDSDLKDFIKNHRISQKVQRSSAK